MYVDISDPENWVSSSGRPFVRSGVRPQTYFYIGAVPAYIKYVGAPITTRRIFLSIEIRLTGDYEPGVFLTADVDYPWRFVKKVGVVASSEYEGGYFYAYVELPADRAYGPLIIRFRTYAGSHGGAVKWGGTLHATMVSNPDDSCKVTFNALPDGSSASPPSNTIDVITGNRLYLYSIGNSLGLEALNALGRGRLRLQNTKTPPAHLQFVSFGEGRVQMFSTSGVLHNTGYGSLQMLSDASSAAPGAPRPEGVVEPSLWQSAVRFGDMLRDTAVSVNHATMLLGERTGARADTRTHKTEGVLFGSGLFPYYETLLSDGLLAIDRIDATRLIYLHDRVLLDGEAASSSEAWHRVVEAVALAAGFDALQRVDMTDNLALHASASYCLQYAAQLVDRLLFDEVMVGAGTFTALLPGALVLGDRYTLDTAQRVQITDALGLVLHLRSDNGHYTAWTMNTDSRASTRYTQYPFNSFMRVGGRNYAASDDGVYRLEGDSDNGRLINAHVRLGMSALGSRLAKHIPSVYLGYAASGDLLLKVITADRSNGERRADIYRLHAKGAASPREGRVQVGRGLNAVYWDFVIENVDGAAFDLDVIEFMPLVVNRRIRGNAGGRL